MKIQTSLRRFLKPTLGKTGVLGMILCLALGAFAPPVAASPHFSQ